MDTWKTLALIAALCIGLFIALYDQFDGVWKLHQLIGLYIMIPSFLLWGLARVQLGMSFSGDARATALVTHGLYSKIRNPIYVFGGLAITGLFTFVNPYLLLALLIIIPLQLTRLRNEARVLEAAFGDEYRAYKRHTWF